MFGQMMVEPVVQVPHLGPLPVSPKQSLACVHHLSRRAQSTASPIRVAGAHPLRNMEPDLPIAVGLKWDWSGIGVNRALASC